MKTVNVEYVAVRDIPEDAAGHLVAVLSRLMHVGEPGTACKAVAVDPTGENKYVVTLTIERPASHPQIPEELQMRVSLFIHAIAASWRLFRLTDQEKGNVNPVDITLEAPQRVAEYVGAAISRYYAVGEPQSAMQSLALTQQTDGDYNIAVTFKEPATFADTVRLMDFVSGVSEAWKMNQEREAEKITEEEKHRN